MQGHERKQHGDQVLLTKSVLSLILQVMEACCGNSSCAGFSYNQKERSGCYKRNSDCGFVASKDYSGFYKCAGGVGSSARSLSFSFCFDGAGTFALSLLLGTAVFIYFHLCLSVVFVSRRASVPSPLSLVIQPPSL